MFTIHCLFICPRTPGFTWFVLMLCFVWQALRRVEETSACLVQELDDPEAWALIRQSPQVFNESTQPKSRKSRRTPRSGGKKRSHRKGDPVLQSPEPEENERVRQALPGEDIRYATLSTNRKSYVENPPSDTSRTLSPENPDTVKTNPSLSSAKSRTKSRPQSSAKSRPQSSTRAKSRQNSYTQSRPSSRAKSRSNSRMEG